jgi:peptide/nickel transport system substrate-binding protein
VWVTNEFAGTVLRIDPATNDVVTIRAGNRPAGIAAAGGLLWFSVRPSGTGHRGGTLVLLTQSAGLVDPATANDPVSVLTLFMTNDGLTAFQRAGGLLLGTQLVPDLAVSLPQPTQGGTTYTFTLRRGIRYSTGKLVRPEDFRYAIERDFRLSSPGIPLYEGIVGGAACASDPATCDLSRGIVTDDHAGTVTFHLVAPDPQFLDKLALSWADAVPVGTPGGGTSTAVPATGPYMIRSYAPGHELRLVRNPHFRPWSPAAQPNGYPDQIVWKIGGGAAAAVTAIERGTADWSVPFPPATRMQELQTQYASQLYIYPGLTTDFLFLNTRVPPFSNPAVRRALNLAIDRARVANQLGGLAYASPACQLLPPGVPGYQRYCPYTAHPSPSGAWTAPDLAKARRLVAASGTKGMRVTVWAGPGDVVPLTSERYVVSVLDRLGYVAHLKSFAKPFSWRPMVADSRTRAQIGFALVIADYPAASDLINPLLSCAAFTPHSPSNTNLAEFCDKGIDAQIRQATQATGRAADQLWARIDHELVNRAPLVPLVNRTWIDFVSKRVGNYQFSWQAGPLLDQFWVRS